MRHCYHALALSCTVMPTGNIVKLSLPSSVFSRLTIHSSYHQSIIRYDVKAYRFNSACLVCVKIKFSFPFQYLRKTVMKGSTPPQLLLVDKYNVLGNATFTIDVSVVVLRPIHTERKRRLVEMSSEEILFAVHTEQQQISKKKFTSRNFAFAISLGVNGSLVNVEK